MYLDQLDKLLKENDRQGRMSFEITELRGCRI